MIFEIISQPEDHPNYWPSLITLKFRTDVDAPEALALLSDAFPNGEFYGASAGGFDNAVEMWG